jgi:O-antigen/teichoic acid export membrane protein
MNAGSLKFKYRYIFSHRGVKRYGVNTLWLFSEHILRMFSTFLVGILIARYLGPEKFGIFNYVLAFVAIFQVIAKLGLDEIVVRDLVKEPTKTEIYLGTSFWLKLSGGILTFIVILIISHFTADNFQTFLFINIIAAGIIFQSFEVIEFYYHATVQAKYITLIRIIHSILSSIIKIALILFKAELIWFVLVTLFDTILLAMFSWLIYKSQKLPNFLRYFKLDLAKRLLTDSFPLLLGSIAVMIYMRIDQVMIKNMLGDRDLGLYSAAVKIVEVWYIIPMVITRSLFPAIVNAKRMNEELYYKRLQQLLFFLIWLAIPLVLLLTILAKHIVLFLYGESFAEASKILSISIWGLLFTFIGVGTSQWLIAENLQNFSFYRTLYGAITNILLNFILIPTFGIVGASIAAVVSYSIAAYFSLFFNKKTLKIFKITSTAFFYPIIILQRKIQNV